MIAAAAALRSGAALLLAARGEPELGAVVSAADVEIIGAGEPWSMGSRAVTAHRIALVVDAPAHAGLTADPAKIEAIRGAFDAAMKTPETALLDLAIVLRLPAVRIGWHRAYRDAPPSYEIERPDPTAVLAGAVALLDAGSNPKAAAILRRATLEAAPVPGASSPPLVRYIVRLDPPDRALAERVPEITEHLRRAVHDAGTRASEAVATVDLGVALHSARRDASARAPSAAPEALLTRALEALGMTVIPVARGKGDGEGSGDGGDEGEVTLAIIGAGEVRLVDIRPGGAVRRGRVPRAGRAEVVSFTVAVGEVSDDAGARAIAASLCAGLTE